MRKAKVAFCILVVLVFIYIASAPYITVYQMKSAAKNHDGEALSEHIEFPSVRQSLKDQMNAMMAKEISEDKEMKDNPFAAAGAAFAGVIVEKIVDMYVTPAGITQLMSGEKPHNPNGDSEESSNTADHEPFANASMSYESFNKFVVRVKDNEDGDGKFVLRRRGLGWKLTEILVPME